MKTHGLPKSSRLCSKTAISALFGQLPGRQRAAKSKSYISYPLRAVWHEAYARKAGDNGVKFLISVPKRRLRHAVDRVLMRRRIREAWRLNRPDNRSELTNSIDLAFVYLADRICSYEVVEKSVKNILVNVPFCKSDENS